MDCRLCDNRRYLTFPDGEYARARLCECSATCQICGGRELIIDAATFPVKSRPCQCRHLKQRIETFNLTGIPARMHSKTVEDFVERNNSCIAAKAHLLRYKSEYTPDRKGFLLWGKPGTGKTHLVCGMARDLVLESGHSVRFIDFFQLLSDLKAGFSDKRSESDLIMPLVAPDVLIIDELGKGRATDWEVSVLDQLISRRYNAGKTVIATTNYDPNKVSESNGMPGLIARIDERIYSRLCEMCDFMELMGEDYRKH